MLITNGNEEKNVTKGAYKQLYERLGYKPVTVIDTTFTEKMLSCIDVLVDGPFVEAEKDLNLPFRGSRNQRILQAPFK